MIKSFAKTLEILDQVEKWMSENNSIYALGSETYSMGDVHLTNILTRLQVNPAFFNDQLQKRPKLQDYFTMVKNRPSYKEADMNFPAIAKANTFIVTFGLFIILNILSLIIWGCYQTYTVETYLWIAGSAFLFFYSLIILLGCIG